MIVLVWFMYYSLYNNSAAGTGSIIIYNYISNVYNIFFH